MKVFLDCDGVLANFDKRAEQLFGMAPKVFEDTYGTKKFWDTIRNDNEFFYNLEPMEDAFELWNYFNEYDDVYILTGCPAGNWAQPQKTAWAYKHFKTDKIITCLSKEKFLHGRPGDLLIDDTLKYRHLWEDMGGHFIHHTSSKKSIDDYIFDFIVPHLIAPF